MRVGDMTRRMNVGSSVKHRMNIRLLIFLSNPNRLADFVALSLFVAEGDYQLSCDVVMAGRRPDVQAVSVTYYTCLV